MKLWLKPRREPFHLCLSSFSLPFPSEPNANRLHMLLTEPSSLPKVNTAKTPWLSACFPSSWLEFHVIWATLTWNQEDCSATLWKMWNIRHTMDFSNLDSVTETWLVCCLADKDGWEMKTLLCCLPSRIWALILKGTLQMRGVIKLDGLLFSTYL